MFIITDAKRNGEFITHFNLIEKDLDLTLYDLSTRTYSKLNYSYPDSIFDKSKLLGYNMNICYTITLADYNLAQSISYMGKRQHDRRTIGKLPIDNEINFDAKGIYAIDPNDISTIMQYIRKYKDDESRITIIGCYLFVRIHTISRNTVYRYYIGNVPKFTRCLML